MIAKGAAARLTVERTASKCAVCLADCNHVNGSGEVWCDVHDGVADGHDTGHGAVLQRALQASMKLMCLSARVPEFMTVRSWGGGSCEIREVQG